MLRLPPGWAQRSSVATTDPRQPGDPIVSHQTVPLDGASLDATAHSLVAELTATCDDLVLLDLEAVRARRGAPALRLLTCWREGDAGRTAEHRLVAHEGQLHVLAAVSDVRRHAQHGAQVRAVLDRFRPGRAVGRGGLFVAPSPGPATGSAVAMGVRPAELAVELLRGPRHGAGRVQLRGGDALVDLPGLDATRRVPAGLVAGWLAGLVGLGPRPRPDCPGHLVVDRGALDDPSAVPPQWRPALEGRVGHWRVGPLEVLDGGPAGLWQVSPVDGEWLAGELDGAPPPARPVALYATDPTRVWDALTGFFRWAAVPVDQ